MSLPAIRPMVPADVDAATAAILRADWGDRRTWFEFATTHHACHPMVAELDGEVVGTGVGTANGAAGWIGTIWVAPSRRGHGLGRALTSAVIDALQGVGCRSLLLVATDEGRPMYERMGFTVQSHYRILEAPGLPAGADSATDTGGATDVDNAGTVVRAFVPADLPGMTALDRRATGEDRAHALERFAAPGTTKVLDVGGAISGFVVRAPWGGGATVAPEIADALRLLQARRRASGPDGRIRVGLLAENEAGLAALGALGLQPIWSAPRFIRGLALDWRPDWIWGQFNHAIG